MPKRSTSRHFDLYPATAEDLGSTAFPQPTFKQVKDLLADYVKLLCLTIRTYENINTTPIEGFLREWALEKSLDEVVQDALELLASQITGSGFYVLSQQIAQMDSDSFNLPRIDELQTFLFKRCHAGGYQVVIDCAAEDGVTRIQPHYAGIGRSAYRTSPISEAGTPAFNEFLTTLGVDATAFNQLDLCGVEGRVTQHLSPAYRQKSPQRVYKVFKRDATAKVVAIIPAAFASSAVKEGEKLGEKDTIGLMLNEALRILFSRVIANPGYLALLNAVKRDNQLSVKIPQPLPGFPRLNYECGLESRKGVSREQRIRDLITIGQERTLTQNTEIAPLVPCLSSSMVLFDAPLALPRDTGLTVGSKVQVFVLFDEAGANATITGFLQGNGGEIIGTLSPVLPAPHPYVLLLLVGHRSDKDKSRVLCSIGSHPTDSNPATRRERLHAHLFQEIRKVYDKIAADPDSINAMADDSEEEEDAEEEEEEE